MLNMLNNIYSKLTPFQGRQDIIINDQSVGDIMQNLLKTHNVYKSEYDKIAGNFERNGTENTARGIYNFIKTNIPYKIESDNRQLLKSPSAILYTANSIGSDCKNYSLFTGGILDALNRRGKRINWCYRFASYKMNDKLPHHVFVVINPGTSNEIWVDAVLPQFNYKKQYNYKVDKNPMALISMAGLEYESIGAPKRKEKKAAAKAAAPAKKAARTKRQAAAAAKLTPGQKIEQAKKIAKRKAEPTPKKLARKAKTKERAKKIKEGIKKTGKAIVRFNPASVAVRNAFLGIVSLNFRSVATNLQKAIQKDRARVEKFWTGAGGKFDALQNVVTKGAARKRLGGIGLAPAAAPAAATVATPLIIKAVNLFKEMGIDAGDLADFGQGVVNKIAQRRLDQLDEAEETGEISDGSDISEFMPGGSGGSGEGSASSPGGRSQEEFRSDPTGTSILNNKTLLIAGAAAAAFFLLRKK
jgi:hypothetical protein